MEGAMLHIDINTGRFSATHQHGWRENLTNQWFSSISHSLTIQLHCSAVQPELEENFYCRQQAKSRHTTCKVYSVLGFELGSNVMPQEVPGPALSVHNAMAQVQPQRTSWNRKGHAKVQLPGHWKAIQIHRYICHALPLDKQIFRSKLCFKIHSFTTRGKPILGSGTGL